MTQHEFHNDAEQSERRDLLDNHLRLKEQASTYFQHSRAEDDEAGGRYAKQRPASVVGSTPTPHYGSAPNWADDASGVEPPLGYDINEMLPVGEIFEQEASLATAPAQAAGSATDIPPTAEQATAAPAGTAVERRRRPTFQRRI